MKMEESPLDVLSRAASIVQNENKAKKRHSAPPMASSDSGIEEDLTTDYTDHSPRHTSSAPLITSPSERGYDSDDSISRKSPRLFRTGKCYRRSSPLHPSSKRALSPRNMSPNMSPRRSPPPTHFTLREGYRGYPHYTSGRKEGGRERRSSESVELEGYSRFKIEDCHIASPKRYLGEDGNRLKKIKIEEDDYEEGLPVLNHCSEGKRLSPKHAAAEHRFLTKSSHVHGDRSPSHHLGPQYTHTYPPYPPLFILTDKPTNYSKLMETYDSIFAPKPPIHPPPLPAYTKCNCGGKNCLIITPPVCSPPPPYREKNDSPYRDTGECSYRREKSGSPYPEPRRRTRAEYSLPNVDDHFRKSLGDKYDLIKCQQANEPPSSVDDHFAKALGQKWFKMQYGSSSVASTRT